MGTSQRRHEPVFPGFREMAARHRLAAELEARRQDLGLTQTQVAALMGTSQSAVARLESGRPPLDAGTLRSGALA